MRRAAEKKTDIERRFRARGLILLVLFACASAVLAAKTAKLQVLDRERLIAEADARHLRTVAVSAHRGSLTDRNGEPLAISTPVDSVSANPRQLATAIDDFPKLARALGTDAEQLVHRVTRNMDRDFVYLRRHLRPDEAAAVVALELPGVDVQREYRRYYPAGEVAGHLVGFTDIDDRGQEGLELTYNHYLAGEPGAKRVLRDNRGRIIEDVESIRPPRHGADLASSIDLRIQYLAYRELATAIAKHGAESGSIVILDIPTGEVLAIVNQPSYNPNDRSQYAVDRYRNRAITDILEPGSSIKPLIVAAALESGRFEPDSVVDTTPGFVEVGAKRISDKHMLGRIDLTTVLARSSNVGITRVALSLEPEQMWRTLTRLGAGSVTSSGFPGESAGLLSPFNHWKEISQATIAYGYGLSLTPLQLARAYAAIGAGGIVRPVSLVRRREPPRGERAISEETAAAVLAMLERVIQPGGTGTKAAVPGYRVAGKTGTAWKYAAGGYSQDKYLSLFAGVAPASDPRLAVVVVVDEPTGRDYYGGDVAAPVFANVMSEALRLLAVPPDDLPAPGPAGMQAQRQ